MGEQTALRNRTTLKALCCSNPFNHSARITHMIEVLLYITFTEFHSGSVRIRGQQIRRELEKD